MTHRFVPVKGFLIAACALIALNAHAGKDRRKKAQPVPETTPVVTPDAPPETGPLFAVPLPLALDELPQGVASLSAQGCHACHDVPHDAWASSAHAQGPSPALLTAADEVDMSDACVSCHRPLQAQHPSTEQPPLPWNATLSSESVTCAACHVRDGAVIAAHPISEAPHITAWRADLGSAETCAACHQLTWPGATTPLYDTYGEWSRSPWSGAGVTCVDCHMGTYGHAFQADRTRALSALLTLDAPQLVRGAAAVPFQLLLQNTGAGHHVPTGSPWVGWRLTLVLVPPAGSETSAVTVLTHDLSRTVAQEAPWNTAQDTRLPAGSSRPLQGTLQLAQDHPAGTWTLELRRHELIRGVVTAQYDTLQDIKLSVH